MAFAHLWVVYTLMMNGDCDLLLTPTTTTTYDAIIYRNNLTMCGNGLSTVITIAL
jgi:hypothetical protein